jgi:bifunctional UDP-N-acetylglucosamine pyrophosphorylase/glucosamine-1-phosphate N-acetyltransferase
VEFRLRSHDRIEALINKGVDIPNPLSIDVGEEVNIDHISGKGVKVYPGCRIYGGKTVIASGSRLGYEAPATIQDCQIGPEVELRGGYFKESVFLEKARMGSGAQVREGCILEEEANGAHCVGIKQTILFPFVTLGSLINFCDCLMAGGTSRKDHSEVGSSYIHFNFTPEGDKACASLIGDVPRGVMLNQPRIFLGGQGGMVGPVRVGFGNVVAAGAILRSDSPDENKLIYGRTYRGAVTNFVPRAYPGLSRLVGNNLLYLANLMALQQWYIHVRQRFFHTQEFGELIYAGVMHKLELAREERISRLRAMADKMPLSVDENGSAQYANPRRQEFHENIEEIFHVFLENIASGYGLEHRDHFLSGLLNHKRGATDYIQVIQGLPTSVSQQGTRWLDQIVRDLCQRAAGILPSLRLFT